MDALLVERPFDAYGLSHGIVLAIFAGGVALAVVLGRRRRGTPAGVRFSKAFAVAILAFQLPLQVYSMLPPHWDIGGSLPLQLCDLAWMAAICALWTHQAWAHALTYYWGLTLTTQAILTPALTVDFPHIGFIMFWGIHCLIVWAAVYLTWGLGLRPDWRSLRITAAITAAWAVAMFAFNNVMDTNYGYLNAKPPTASILDALGPWPWYLLWEFAIGLTVWALITWPWVRKLGSESNFAPKR